MTPVCSSWIRRNLSLVLIATLSAPVAHAVAAPSKVVAALVGAAQREFDAGNFARAGELFLAIWKQDSTQLAAIYNAARAFQLAGNLDKSEELFREILALPGLDPGLKAKCDGQLEAIADKRGERKAEAAAKAERDGKIAIAAELWADALRSAPTKRPWLLRYGRALHLAGRKEEARQVYEDLLKGAPANDPDRATLEDWLAQLQQTQPAPGAIDTDAPPSAVRAESGVTWPALASLGVGALGIVGGGVLLMLARSDDAALQAKFAKLDDEGHIVGITPAQAAQSASAIETRYTQGWVVAGVGVVALGAGAWLWRRSPAAQAALLPTGRGALLVVQF